MKTTRKFLFDTCFDAAAPVAAAEPEQETESQAPPPAPEPSFGPAELEAARAEGFAAGHAAGLAEARDDGERAVSRAVAAIGEALPSLAAEQDRILAEHERDAVAAALTVIRKLFPRLAASESLAEVEQVVRECLERLREEPRIVVRVADALLDRLRERIDALALHTGFEGKIVLLADDGLALDAVRVEWADGGAERDSGELWQAIDAVLAGFLDGRPCHEQQAVTAAAADNPRDQAIDPTAGDPPAKPSANGELRLARTA